MMVACLKRRLIGMPRKPKGPVLNQLVLERLMHYFHLVGEQIPDNANGWLTSPHIAQ